MHFKRTALTLILLLGFAGSAAAAEPWPDHPITGKPMQPTLAYSYPTVSELGHWKMRCYVPLRTERFCIVTSLTRAGMMASLNGRRVEGT